MSAPAAAETGAAMSASAAAPAGAAPAAAAPAPAASHIPTASSPSAVLQLSYEAAVSHPATPATATSGSSQSNDASSSASTGAATAGIPAVQLDAESAAAFDRILTAQGENNVRPFFINKYETEAVKNWDRFYKKNADRFYKDRHYLSNEFKELGELLAAERRERGEPEPEPAAAASSDDGEAGAAASPAPSSSSSSASASPPAPLLPITEPTSVAVSGQRRLLEVGCGVGNAMFPLLRVHPSLFVYGVDCSKNAIQCVQNHPDYLASGRCAAWVVDLVTDELPGAIGRGQLDFATLVFVLSAIHPTKMGAVLRKVHAALKQDEGVLFLRDYCMYDLAQLRFAKTSKLGPSWYVRQDGTRSYFFTLPELSQLLVDAGFEILEAQTVRKLVVNRKEKSEMSRRFVQIRARAKMQTDNGQSEIVEAATSATSSQGPAGDASAPAPAPAASSSVGSAS